MDPPFSPSAILGPEIGMLILVLTIALSLTVIMLQWFEKRKPILSYLNVILLGTIAILYLVTIHDSLAPIALG
ncbi:MAG: hypothetical protein ACTSQZ_03485, partial [Candidatus Thorarchaeota archaeon]